MSPRSPITVALARFEDIVGRGLRALIDEDESLELVAADVPHDRAARASSRATGRRSRSLNFGSLRSAGRDPRAPRRAARAPGCVVLGQPPDGGRVSQMLAFGATACLAKSAEARDVLHAIHLASRGLHVLPPLARPETRSTPAGPELLTPREADVLELLQAGRSNAEIAQTPARRRSRRCAPTRGGSTASSASASRRELHASR